MHKVRPATMYHKYKFMNCADDIFASYTYDFVILDGCALIHSLPGTIVQGKTLNTWFNKVFLPEFTMGKFEETE